MTKDEKEAMREGFEKLLAAVERRDKVIEKLISYLHMELGTAAASALLNELNSSK